MDIGLCTFGDAPPDPGTRVATSPEQRLAELIEEVELADQLGLDVWALGEHHRPDYTVSSPATVLAAAAVRTKRIRLSSGVTVLSSEDPVRVFQQFATVDLLSHGRAEIMAGRGSFIESFPLFGQSLDDYDALFAEKLDLLLRLREGERITWSGAFRAPIADRGVYPRPVQRPLPVWIAVGGTPASVARAGRLGLPLMIAIIGGQPARFGPLADFYRAQGADAGHGADALRLGLNMHAYLADDSQRAADEAWAPYADVMTRIGRERGWPPTTREQYEAMRAPDGALLVGSPQQVIDKMLAHHARFRHDRFLAQIGVGALPHARVMRAIELFGTQVAPVVRREVTARAGAAPGGA